MNKITFVLITLILTGAIIVLIYYTFYNQPAKNCLDLDSFKNLKLQPCIDTDTNTIFIKINRSSYYYEVSFLKIVFNNKVLFLTEKEISTAKVINYTLEEPINSMNATLKLRSADTIFCDSQKTFEIPECSPEIKLELVKGKTKNITLNTTIEVKSDIVPISFAKKESLFDINCTSSWTCGSWEQCVSGIQKRECNDSNKCLSQLDTPDFTKKCEGCNEKWQCSWSPCINKESTPSCTDLNNCGAQFNKPSKINCDVANCIPEVLCSDWSSCLPNYNFLTLQETQNIKGVKQRLCQDKNSCASSFYEKQECSMRIDIYTKKATICGKEYTEVYNKLSNILLGRIYSNINPLNPELEVSLYQTIPTGCDQI